MIFLKTIEGNRTASVLYRTFAATIVVIIGLSTMNTAKASVIDYQVVETALANSESLGAGFDILLEAAVFEDDMSGKGTSVAFRFSNPSTLQGGLSGGGSDARIHEIYFEKNFDQHIVTPPFFRSDGTEGAFSQYNGTMLKPATPPGIQPEWLDGFGFGLDEGSGATGVGDSEFFEVYFQLLGTSTIMNTDDLLAVIRSPLLNTRVAMHIGDCVASDDASDDDDSGDDDSGDDASGDDASGDDDSGDGGGSCVIDTWPPPSPSPVPLPAALPLYGTGLALMGFMGWRKKPLAAKA